MAEKQMTPQQMDEAAAKLRDTADKAAKDNPGSAERARTAATVLENAARAARLAEAEAGNYATAHDEQQKGA